MSDLSESALLYLKRTSLEDLVIQASKLFPNFAQWIEEQSKIDDDDHDFADLIQVLQGQGVSISKNSRAIAQNHERRENEVQGNLSSPNLNAATTPHAKQSKTNVADASIPVRAAEQQVPIVSSKLAECADDSTPPITNGRRPLSVTLPTNAQEFVPSQLYLQGINTFVPQKSNIPSPAVTSTPIPTVPVHPAKAVPEVSVQPAKTVPTVSVQPEKIVPKVSVQPEKTVPVDIAALPSGEASGQSATPQPRVVPAHPGPPSGTSTSPTPPSIANPAAAAPPPVADPPPVPATTPVKPPVAVPAVTLAVPVPPPSGAYAFERGMVFKASAKTYKECLSRMLFGLPSNQWDKTRRTIRPDATALFLYNVNSLEMEGVFVATEAPGLDLVPEAWKGSVPHQLDDSYASPFPVQVRVKKLYDWRPVAQERFEKLLRWHQSGKHFDLVLDAPVTASLVAAISAAQPKSASSSSSAAAAVASASGTGARAAGAARTSR